VSWWSDLVDIISQGPVQGGAEAAASAITGTTIGPPGTGAAGLASSSAGFISLIEGIWAGLTDGKMWRSLGWLLLGIVLMLMGASMWAGLSGKIPPVIPV
jgi:hypothetical protein